MGNNLAISFDEEQAKFVILTPSETQLSPPEEIFKPTNVKSLSVGETGFISSFVLDIARFLEN